MAGVKLTERAARKTAEAVHRVLSESRDRRDVSPPTAIALPYTFPVKITDEPSTGAYSWKRLRPKDDGTLQEVSDPAITGDANAYAIDGAETLRTDGKLTVWLVPNGLDADGNPRFIFDYERVQPAKITSSTQNSADPPRHTYTCEWGNFGSAGGYGSISASGNPSGGFTARNLWEDEDRSANISLDPDGDGTDELRWLAAAGTVYVRWNQYSDGSGGEWWFDRTLSLEGNCDGFS